MISFLELPPLLGVVGLFTALVLYRSILKEDAGDGLVKKIGDQITRGEKIYRIFNSNREKLEVASKLMEETFKITDQNESVKLIIDES